MHKTIQIGNNGIETELTFDDLNGYTEFPFDDGTFCVALLRAAAKFGPRYAALELRLHKLYLLDVDPEIIDLTIDELEPPATSL